MTPVELARAGSEAIRALNHATLGLAQPGYEWPADVDAAIAELQVLAERLPQALRQASSWLELQHSQQQVGHDLGFDVALSIRWALEDLAMTAGYAGLLAGMLGRVRSHTAHLTGVVERSIP